MQNLKSKLNNIETICYVMKVLALFFCFYPLFDELFSFSSRQSISEMNLQSIATSLGLLLGVMLLWLLIRSDKRGSAWQCWLEISVFFSVCLVSILLSGANQSQYKFLYIFLVVAYTIQYGFRYGLTISAAAAIALLSMDLLCGGTNGINADFQSDIALSIMYGMITLVLGKYIQLEQENIRYLTRLANYDGLTQLYNHRYFHQSIDEIWQKSQQTGKGFSLIMIDIDYFKHYNDIWGHQKGDEVLIAMAQLVKSVCRPQDIACRYGGEEFMVILPGISQADAHKTAEKIRSLVEEYGFEGEEYLPNGQLTVSLGVSTNTPADTHATDIIARADAALYRAKYLRKNRVETYQNIFDQFTDLDETTKDALVSIRALIGVTNIRDDYTYTHTERVVYCCELAADEMHLPKEQRRTLLIAAYLHDIGKSEVPHEILIADRPLSDAEWGTLRQHPRTGENIISKIAGMEEVSKIIGQHHERYDGNGYPDHLKGDEIHPLAAILTLADSFDAMTVNRPYQKARTYPEAFAEIRRCAGTQFKPEDVEPFITAIEHEIHNGVPEKLKDLHPSM